MPRRNGNQELPEIWVLKYNHLIFNVAHTLKTCYMDPIKHYHYPNHPSLAFVTLISISQDFPGGPVVKNLPCNAGDMGSILGQGTKIPMYCRASNLASRS